MIVMDNKVAWRVSLIDKLLEGEISKSSLSSECAVLLSGGVDSISVAFAAQRLGKTIHAYSFCLDKNESYDYKKAKEIAEQELANKDTSIDYAKASAQLAEAVARLKTIQKLRKKQ